MERGWWDFVWLTRKIRTRMIAWLGQSECRHWDSSHCTTESNPLPVSDADRRQSHSMLQSFIPCSASLSLPLARRTSVSPRNMSSPRASCRVLLFLTCFFFGWQLLVRTIIILHRTSIHCPTRNHYIFNFY